MNVNAEKCVAYLRRIGIEITESTAAAWIAREEDDRARRRAARAELKRSCGHFRTRETRVIHDGGDEMVTNCSDCGRYLRSRPTPTRPPNGGGEPLPVARSA